MERVFVEKDIKKLLLLFEEYRIKKKTIMEYEGHIVKMMSDRYDCFLKSIICPVCGLKASFFAMERGSGQTGRYHWNLYGIKDGKEILFTKDHIIPKSKGGRNHPSNYETMCQVCNTKKGNKI